MKLFHETRGEEGMRSILRDGFSDSEPIHSLGIHAGVWLSDSAAARAATGGTGHRLTVDVPDDVASRFLITGSPGEVVGHWGEFCIPAEIVNRYPVAEAL